LPLSGNSPMITLSVLFLKSCRLINLPEWA
jgi:hypothetical protein